MVTLMSYLAAFGLASGAGAKAFVPVFLLGAFHYTALFELSERWRWLADPVVMSVLGVLIVLEIVVDAHPELGRLSDVVSYLPKAVAGFLLFAAATGTVDQDLASLAGSGLLGGATAAGVHWIRTGVRRPLRDLAEDLHGAVGTTASLTEAGTSAALAGSAVVAPPLGLGLAALLGAVALVVGRRIDRRRTPCVHCGQPIRPGAVVCIHCGRAQTSVG